MNNIVNYLKECDIFYQLTPTQLEMIADLCQEVFYPAGETIFKENSNNKELYIIIQGEVEILINPSSVGPASLRNKQKDTVITKLRRGQSFGEIALVDEGLRSASARTALYDTRLLVIARDNLILLCETNPELGYRLMYNLAADIAMKIRNADLRIREKLLYIPRDDKK